MAYPFGGHPRLVDYIIVAIYCGPWLPASISYYRAEQEYAAESGAKPTEGIIALHKSPMSEKERAETEKQIDRCAQSFICSFIDDRAIRIADTSSHDPVAFFTIILAISTIGLWSQTKRLAIGAEVQIQAIQTELTISRDDFISTHRPWVNFTTHIKPPGITVDANGITFVMRFQCKNTGTSPAMSASVNARPYLWSPMIPERARQKTICKELSAPIDAPTTWGAGIMPGEQEILDMTYNIPRADFDVAVAAGQAIVVCVSGCIDYAFSFGTPDPHMTGFVFHIGKIVPGQAQLRPIEPMDTAIPAPQVFLSKSLVSGAFFAT